MEYYPIFIMYWLFIWIVKLDKSCSESQVPVKGINFSFTAAKLHTKCIMVEVTYQSKNVVQFLILILCYEN